MGEGSKLQIWSEQTWHQLVEKMTLEVGVKWLFIFGSSFMDTQRVTASINRTKVNSWSEAGGEKAFCFGSVFMDTKLGTGKNIHFCFGCVFMDKKLCTGKRKHHYSITQRFCNIAQYILWYLQILYKRLRHFGL